MPTTTISVTWQDVEGLQKTEVLHFDVGDVATVAAAQAQITAYEALLQDVSGCIIASARVTFPLTVETVEVADNGYSVRSGAYLSFVDSDSRGQGIYIPGILGDKIADDVVDANDTEVAALLAAITGSGVGGEEPLSTKGSAAQWTSYRGGKGASRKV